MMFGPWIQNLNKINLKKELETINGIIEEKKRNLEKAKYKCPYCGKPAYYVGFNSAECTNKDCKFYCEEPKE